MVDSIMNMVSPQMASTLASRLGGSTTAVQTGLGTSVAAVLGTIAEKSGDSGLMGRIFSLVSGSNSQSILSSLPNLASGAGVPAALADQGSKLTSMLFGGQQSGVENLIARQAGLGGSAGSGVMSMAAPLVMGFLGQHIASNGLNASSFASMMASERSKLQGFLPAGFGSLLSGGGAAVPGPIKAPPVHVPTPPPSSGAGKPILLVVALLAIAFIAWLSMRSCNNPANKVAETTSQATSAVANTANSAIAALGEFFKRKLPDGTELNIPRLGIENKLIDFIEDSSKPVDKTTWFDFDRLLFDTGKATLQPSSQEQLQNIAAILKAYPKVKVKIGGYTDNTGNKEANLKLSQDRATNVMNELVKLGVDHSRMEAEGYGEDHPVADNATEEGRARNRRISLRVTEK